MERNIKNNPVLAFDIHADHNNISERLNISYFLKTLKLVIMIFNLSFFVGHYWWIFCEITTKISTGNLNDNDIDHNYENFIDFFEL